MKNKKFISLASVCLSACFLGACANTNQKVIFSDYWNKDANIPSDTLTEELAYNVSYEEGIGLGENYNVQYTNGAYTTKLTTAVENGKMVYTYETKLTINVTYVLGSNTVEFSDYTNSVVRFEKAANALRPLSSSKNFVNHSPTGGSEITELKNCFVAYDYSVETNYNEDGAGGTSITTSKNCTCEACKAVKGSDIDATPTTKEDTFEIDTEKYNYLDNEQLLFALRGINPSVSASPIFNVYSPFVKGVQLINVSFSSKTGADFTFNKNGTQVTETINYYPVKLSINDKNSGATQTAWIAQTTDPQNNAYRNVMLRLETPLSYNLGKLIYTLSSANFN